MKSLIPVALLLCVAAGCTVPQQVLDAQDRAVEARNEAIAAAKSLQDALEAYKKERSDENALVLNRALEEAGNKAKALKDASEDLKKAVDEHGTGMPAWLLAVLTILGVRVGSIGVASAAPNTLLAKAAAFVGGGSGFANKPPSQPSAPAG